jgi:hypothetical protein
MLRVWAMTALAGCSFVPGAYRAGDGGADDGDLDGETSDSRELDAAPIPITFLQDATFTNAGSNSFVAATFPGAQLAGSLNVVVISWTDQNDMVAAVGDTSFNVYFSANSLLQSQGFSQRIYYAPNIKAAGANLVTVALTGNVPSPKIRIFEYSGIAPALPVDMSMAAGGSSATASAGPVNTVQPRELVFAATTSAPAATGPGPDFTQRQLDGGDLVEDRVADTAGPTVATAPLTSPGNWIMQLVAFKGIQ